MSPFALRQQQVLKLFIRIAKFYCNFWRRGSCIL